MKLSLSCSRGKDDDYTNTQSVVSIDVLDDLLKVNLVIAFPAKAEQPGAAKADKADKALIRSHDHP